MISELLLLVTMAVSKQQRAYQVENSLANQTKLLCSAIFVVGRNPYEYIENDLRTINHYHNWDNCSIDIDFENKSVTVSTKDGLSKTATHNKSQGCVILPEPETDVSFKAINVEPRIADQSELTWPMGDGEANGTGSDEIDQARLSKVLDNIMGPNPTHGIPLNTRALVVVHDGKIVGERYGSGFNKTTRHISWSMGKSVTAALIGILIKEGHFELNDPVPINEWKDDSRSEITINNLIRMSSGLKFQRSTDNKEVLPFTDEDHHHSVYHKAMDVHEFATSMPLEYKPGTVWRYRNCDTLSLGKVVRDTVESSGRSYLEFPQRYLYDKIGIRDMIHETDIHGNFIFTGFNYGTARDWARFGLLHLWEGEWLGEQILPENWIESITSPAPANPDNEYGGQFWLNKGGNLKEVPRDAYAARGLRGQITMVIPSLDLVIVRLGHSPNYDQHNTLIREIVECIDKEAPIR